MTDSIIYTVVSLAGLGLSSAFVLYLVAKVFYVDEDPRIGVVENILPGTNCGGCGSPGCRPFAEKLVNSPDITSYNCPVGGSEVMKQVSDYLGKEVGEHPPMVAVLLCNGKCDIRPKVNIYDGPKSCKISGLVFSGDTGCSFGCDGYGDCVAVCDFDAIHMDEKTNLPVVDSAKCTACNACVLECPKNLLELRPKKKRDLKIYVACKNEEKGGIAKRSCDNACIGCSKCMDVCPKDAIVIENYLAYIDADSCTLCRKCVPVCPTHSIVEVGFPPPKIKKPVDAKTKVKKPVVAKIEVKKVDKLKAE